MRRNDATAEYMETERVLDLKPRKKHGSYNKHKIVPGSNSPDNEGPHAKRYPRLRNDVWSYHLITMLTKHGRIVWIFSVIDEHTQEYLRCLVAHHISAQNVIDELFSLFLQRGIPRYLFAFNDNGTIAKAICQWIEKLEIDSPFVESKRYEENGCGTLFKEKLMKDLSNEKSLASLVDVRSWLGNWRNDHNRSINLLRI